MKLGPDLKVDAIECPSCGIALDGQTRISVDDDKSEEELSQPPDPGDVGLCVYCLGWWEMVEPGLARVMTFKQIFEMAKKEGGAEAAGMCARTFVTTADNHAHMVRTGKLKIERVKE